ncbi:hypothetical protein AKJ44_01870 [candidate division MSBL1 archaeon SCGC-AAA261F17]|uniref:Uncharacterized protein n=1 Tax=candidate division MSBL1 archaeon SCGC-AAA261F17 TaxID=1698274 RepID=A0A133V659_9EURY|nr:hypothetical protein AKJ44_01870 [candidate division MSBL1 archaeon SCGC-AAA261F17]
MPQVNVNINQISAEKFWKSGKQIPLKVQVSTNVNIVEVERESEDILSVPFVISISYNPSIAQITLKGEARVGGEKSELEAIYEGYENKESPPPRLIQQITNNSLAEATMLSRTLNIPPPIPLPTPQARKKKEGKEEERPSYVG